MRASWASSAATRAAMQGNRSRDTAPELALRSAVHALGLRYRVAMRPIPSSRRSADLVFTAARVAVFLDGCFWHGCPDHHRPPVANAQYWAEKIARNRERDHETDQLLIETGWVVIRIWEHENPQVASLRVAEVVRSRRSSTSHLVTAPSLQSLWVSPSLSREPWSWSTSATYPPTIRRGTSIRPLTKVSSSGHHHRMPVPLFSNKPKYCPYGHSLAPGMPQRVSWLPCMCGPAREAGSQGRGLGHMTVWCGTCSAEDHRDTTFYEPPHQVGHSHTLSGWVTRPDVLAPRRPRPGRWPQPRAGLQPGP